MSLLLACAAVASAAVKPYALAELGMSIPVLEGDLYDDETFKAVEDEYDFETKGEGTGELCWKIGGGVQVPMGEQFSLDAWAAYASVPYNAKHTLGYSGSETLDMGGTVYQYSFKGEGVVDIDITTSLVEFGGGVRWSATPTLGLGCGFEYSHVLGSEYTGTFSTSATTTSSQNSSTQEHDDKRKIKGDLEDIEKELRDTTESPDVRGFDCKPQDFFSLRIGADYAFTPSVALTAAYQLPLADHLDGKTLKGSLHRVTGGIRFTFGAN